jgi:hypothetical protein
MTFLLKGPFDLPRRAVRSAFATTMSRRDFLPLFAGVAGVTAVSTVLTVKPALAQGNAWKEYRRNDFGFRIEMPGVPQVETKEDQVKDVWIRAIEAEVQHGQSSLTVNCIEWKDAPNPEEHFEDFVEGMKAANMAVTRESAMMMNGFQAKEFVCQTDTTNYIRREVVMEKLTIGAMVFGDRGIHTDATVKRFMESFKLLRSAPKA